MLEEATADIPAVQLTLRRRVRHGLRRSHNWFQLVRFGAVGASGYVVNLVTYTVCLHAFGLHYLAAGTVAFVVAVTNNFVWNRHWTFDARDGHAGFQAARFFAVSVAAFLFSLAMLEALVGGLGVDKVLAQAIAIVTATPLNFLGNKLWSFAA
ncbi:MAG TPA: GtrA family protein [Solirubrobacteraceae bacterium]|jgi:putative flippase GtrA|nr:GtrA family protein [Solirubrobacteraceae bacterium]